MVSHFSQYISILTDASVRILATGDSLFCQGDAAQYIYVVEKGKVRMLRYTIEGHQVNLHTAVAGESFAEAALFADHYHCNAIADTESRILCYSKKEILAMLRSNPERGEEFMALLAQQIRTLRTHLELRTIRSAFERVLQYFLLLSDLGNNDIIIDSSWKSVAHELGLAHETFYRTLAKLEKQGFIERKEKTIKVIKLTL